MAVCAGRSRESGFLGWMLCTVFSRSISRNGTVYCLVDQAKAGRCTVCTANIRPIHTRAHAHTRTHEECRRIPVQTVQTAAKPPLTCGNAVPIRLFRNGTPPGLSPGCEEHLPKSEGVFGHLGGVPAIAGTKRYMAALGVGDGQKDTPRSGCSPGCSLY